jgi:hypothetical protein
MGLLQKRDTYKNAKLGHLKMFFSRTTGPEKFRFTQKLSDIMQIQIY